MTQPQPTFWLAKSLDEPYDPAQPFNAQHRHKVENSLDANLQSSLWTDGFHRPTLDIDIPCEYRPSTTPGHGHLILPTVKLSWLQYDVLLGALARAGIIEEGFHGASRHSSRQMTFIRTPWTRKPLGAADRHPF